MIHSDTDHIKEVIPVKAGIYKSNGFRAKPGMKVFTRLMSSRIGAGVQGKK